MKLKNIFLAVCAALATALPVSARIESETSQLISQLDSDGVVIMVNSSMCKRQPIHGAYVTYGDGSRSFVLCPGDTWDAEDHSTVRHEMTHALQHCINIKRGTPRGTPILDTTTLMSRVHENLSPDTINFIRTSYEQSDWLIEYEANLAEHTMTASQLIHIWREARCSEVFNT